LAPNPNPQRDIEVGDVVKATYANGDVDLIEVRKIASFEVPASEAHRFDDGARIEIAEERGVGLAENPPGAATPGEQLALFGIEEVSEGEASPSS
jgi:hypothetical protein